LQSETPKSGLHRELSMHMGGWIQTLV